MRPPIGSDCVRPTPAPAPTSPEPDGGAISPCARHLALREVESSCGLMFGRYLSQLEVGISLLQSIPPVVVFRRRRELDSEMAKRPTVIVIYDPERVSISSPALVERSTGV